MGSYWIYSFVLMNLFMRCNFIEQMYYNIYTHSLANGHLNFSLLTIPKDAIIVCVQDFM